MTAISKTDQLKRVNLPIGLLDANSSNPNVMGDQEFNLLYDNMEKVGFVDPVFVRPVGGRYRIVGGHHRVEVGKLLGFTEVPCTVIDDPDFDEDQEKFQLVRMNVIHGKLSPEKFLKLYEQVSQKYSDQILKDSFGFAEDKEFRKLIRSIKAELPSELKTTFADAAKDIKTIDELAALMNRLMGAFGDTLPYGYMLMDFGGKESVWLRMGNDSYKAMIAIGDLCKREQRTVDDLLGGVLQLIAKGELDSTIAQLVAATPQVELPEVLDVMPTKDYLDHLS